MNRGNSPSRIDPAAAISDAEPWIGAKQFELAGFAGGCLMTFGSAMVTCCLLVLNGALVMAILAAMSATGVEWVKKEPASQFMLFAGPICLTIMQWMMIDTLRGIFRRQRRRRDAAHPE